MDCILFPVLNNPSQAVLGKPVGSPSLKADFNQGIGIIDDSIRVCHKSMEPDIVIHIRFPGFIL